MTQHYPTSQGRPAPLTSRASEIMGAVAITVMAVGAVLYCRESWLVATGYISHTRTANIYFEGDWIQGENKECAGVRKNPPVDNELVGLDCPAEPVMGGSTHNVSIRFFGKTNRPDVSLDEEFHNKRFQWRCRREADSFTCFALN